MGDGFGFTRRSFSSSVYPRLHDGKGICLAVWEISKLQDSEILKFKSSTQGDDLAQERTFHLVQRKILFGDTKFTCEARPPFCLHCKSAIFLTSPAMSTWGSGICVYQSPFSSSRPLGQYEAEAVGRAPDLMAGVLLI